MIQFIMKKYLIIIVLVLCSCTKNSIIEQPKPINSIKLLSIIEDIEKDIPFQIIEERFIKDSDMFIYLGFRILNEKETLSIYTASEAPYFAEDIENIDKIDINTIGIKGYFRLNNGRKVVIYDRDNIGKRFYNTSKLIKDSIGFIHRDLYFGKEAISVNYRIYQVEDTNLILKIKNFKTNIKGY